MYYLSSGILIRKEHFGTLILMQNGHRYQIDNEYYEVLKLIKDGENLENNIRYKDILDEFIELGIITHIFSSTNTSRLINNDFVSNDCLSFPRTVYIECSDKCNISCLHCYTSSGTKMSNEISLDTMIDLIDELSDKGSEFLCIGGGEPLMYKHLYSTISHCYKRNIAVEVSTNGLLINDHVINNLLNANLKYIQVSLDGASEKTYNKIREGSNFNQVILNIKKLSKNFVTSISTVATSFNIHEIDKIIDLAIELGVKSFRVIPLMPTGRADNSMSPSLEQMKYLNEYIYKRNKTENNIHIQFNENLIHPNSKNIPWMPDNHVGCSAARSTCGIDSKGNVYPCSYLNAKELICGNIYDKTLLQIWTESNTIKSLRELDNLKGECATCSYLSNCGGGCRAAAYLRTNDISQSDPLCTVHINQDIVFDTSFSVSSNKNKHLLKNI